MVITNSCIGFSVVGEPSKLNVNEMLYSVNGGTYNKLLTIHFIIIILLGTHKGLKNKVKKIIAYMCINSLYRFKAQTKTKFLCIYNYSILLLSTLLHIRSQHLYCCKQ